MRRTARTGREPAWPVLLTVLTLPVLFFCLGGWQAWRGAAARAVYEELAVEQGTNTVTRRNLERQDADAGRPDGRRRPVGEAVARSEQATRAADLDLLVAQAREGAAWLTMSASMAAGAGGVAGLLLLSRSARRGERSRRKLVAAFGRVSRILPLLLAAQVVGTVLAVAAAVAFEVGELWFVSEPSDNTVILAILVLICTGLVLRGGGTSLRNLRSALQAFVPEPLAITALPITDAQAPGFFALLRDLARERGTTLPETVAVGADRSFFVTAYPLLLHGEPGAAPTAAHGRTLHLPLFEMAMLDIEELRTVLAHELAHFSGKDTAYSLHFQPLFAGLGRKAAAMSLRRMDWGSTLVDRVFERVVHPQTALAVYAFDRFDHTVAHWRRSRELEADRAAMASESPGALASSLLRLGLVQESLGAELDGLAGQPEIALPDLTAALVARMGAESGRDAAAHLGDEVPHPTDTHPPSWQRIAAAGVAVDGTLLARASRPVDPADLAAMRALFADWDGVAGDVTGLLRERARRDRDMRRDMLRETAAATGEPTATTLHASLLRPVVSLLLLGSFYLATSVTCVLAALYGGAEDRESWRLLAGIAAACTVGLGYVVLWSVRLWRGRKMPFLVLTAEGLQSPGFTSAVRWVDITDISVSAAQATTRVVVRDEVPLPRRTGLIRRLQIDPKQRALQFAGMAPRGINSADYHNLLMRHAEAARARSILDVEFGAPEPNAAPDA